MCYSEQLTECNAYETEHGWVHVAYKAVLVQDDGELQPLIYSGGPLYRPRRLVRDRHGYHVAATRKGAWSAALHGDREAYDRKTATALAWIRRIERERDGRVRVVRCLVPTASIGKDNHCHALYVLPLRTRETEADIEAVDRENARLARAVDGRQRALDVLRGVTTGATEEEVVRA